MKRLIMVALMAALAPLSLTGATSAEADEVADVPTCTEEHLTGDQCQGPDVSADPARCAVKVWVGEATCESTPADGIANRVYVFGQVYADEGVVPEFDWAIRDTEGNVLAQGHQEFRASDGCDVDEIIGTVTSPVTARPCAVGMTSSNIIRSVSAVPGPVTCEITGTHAKLGGATAAVGEVPNADLPNFGETGPETLYTNRLICEVT